MEYYEAANFLFDLRRYPPRPGTESTARLLEHLGSPHEGIRYVQVAGSNGKGSTARMVERVLRESGLDVGLYTSPHMDDVRERVRVNGRPVAETAVAEFVEATREYVVEQVGRGDGDGDGRDSRSSEDSGARGVPTFFEATTALALWEFGRADVDVAVLEVGIGGRYDATSAIDPEASAVTSVTLEHADVLGDTVEEIARDKAHVAPTDNPLVTATTGGTLAAVREVAGDVLTVGDDCDGEDREGDESDDGGLDVSVTYGGREGLEGAVTLSGPDWTVETRLALLGAHQARNAGIAAALARQVADVTEDELARGLRNAHWRGRFEVLGRDPLVVLDGAHNAGGCESVATTLDEFEYDDLHLVFGAMTDKDHRAMADALPADRVTTCRPAVERAEDEDVLAATFRAAGHDDVRTRPAVEAALADALERAGPDDCVLVAGSLYAVAEARRRWTRVQIPTRVETLDDARAALERANVPSGEVRQVGAEGVHRVLRARVQHRQAQRLAEELLSAGGECAVAGVNDRKELVDVALLGTLAQFERLADALDAQPFGLPVVADELRETLGIGEGVEPGPESGPGSGPGGGDYPWADGTAVMGILNVTPDSFHDGGRYDATPDAVTRAEEMVAAGADIVDVGGESTRPGADPVPVEEEKERVLPVVERLADLDALVSIDTRKPDVARAALDAGADILNDVSGLEAPEMRLVAAEYDVPVVVMHSIETPVNPDREVAYDDVVEDVLRDLTERVLLAERAGLDRSQIIVDPGLGFGKTRRENFALLDRLDEFRALGCPVLVGHSHKSMFALVGAEPGDAFHETVAGTALAAERGADIVRVHDVRANAQAVRVAEATDDPGAFVNYDE